MPLPTGLTALMLPLGVPLLLIGGAMAYSHFKGGGRPAGMGPGPHRGGRRPGGPPRGALPPGGSAPRPAGGPMPTPGVPTASWVDPGMAPQYQQAVWSALYYDRDPRRLHAFGDRLREMRMHRASEALHSRAAMLSAHHEHEAHRRYHQPHHSHGGPGGPPFGGGSHGLPPAQGPRGMPPGPGPRGMQQPGFGAPPGYGPPRYP